MTATHVPTPTWRPPALSPAGRVELEAAIRNCRVTQVDTGSGISIEAIPNTKPMRTVRVHAPDILTGIVAFHEALTACLRLADGDREVKDGDNYTWCAFA